MLKSKNVKSINLKDVTSLLGELRIPTSLVFTPINLREEKLKFFDSDTYNPIFKYKVVRNQNSKILKELVGISTIVDVDPRISSFYIELINSKREANDLMNYVGDNEKVTEISANRFGIPSPILFRNACRILRGKHDNYHVVEKPSKKQKLLEYDEIESAFNIVFEKLGLRGWILEKSQNIARNGIKVGVKRSSVYADPYITKSAFSLRKTIIHEVGTHVLRAENGRHSGFEALSKPNVVSYLDVEEGLATYNEEVMGVLKVKDLKKKALYVFAQEIGVNMSFRELFNALSAVCMKHLAFDVTYRVKRGMGNTVEPGVYFKDIVYFRGFRRLRKRLSVEPLLYNKLYAGKIGFKQVNWVEEGLIKKPKHLPTKEIFDSIFKEAGI